MLTMFRLSSIVFTIIVIALQPLSAREHGNSVGCDNVLSPDDAEYESARRIVSSIFYGKVVRLVDQGILTKERASLLEGATFVICKNSPPTYEAYMVYTHPPVLVLEMHTVGFLYAQARALILGQYVANKLVNDDPVGIHRAVIELFVMQSDILDGGLFEFMESTAEGAGVTAEFVSRTIDDPLFKEREQVLFLQSLYFLIFHELCHVFLRHGSELQKVTDSERSRVQQQHEYEADACAIDLMGRDEKQYSSSPVFFLGVLATVSSQLMVDAVLEPSALGNTTATSTHPASQERLKAVGSMARSYILASQSGNEKRYLATTEGVLEYFLALADELKAK